MVGGFALVVDKLFNKINRAAHTYCREERTDDHFENKGNENKKKKKC